MNKNGDGILYSVGYTYYYDDIEEFRGNTFDRFAGAAIPSDRKLGWIVPDSLQDRWKLKIGKSQREIHNLFCGIEEIDMFIHGSEHSHPYMMFEYEIAREWISENGVILSDDINQSLAFDVFNRVRDTRWG